LRRAIFVLRKENNGFMKQNKGFEIPLSTRKATMRWYHYVAYFFGGMFLANAVPHLVSGTLGRMLQTPFASPPGVGLSSALVNVLWGFVNLAVGYVLVARVGAFDFRNTRHALALGAGILVMSILLARTFARFNGGL
jgi:hypothetical protein